MNKIKINSQSEFETFFNKTETDWVFGGEKSFYGISQPEVFPVIICYDWEYYEDTGNYGLMYSFVYMQDFENKP